MTRYYDADGEPTTAADLARDVLDDEEQRQYAQSRRNQPRATTHRGPMRLRVNEDGYDQRGDWHPEPEWARAEEGEL